MYPFNLHFQFQILFFGDSLRSDVFPSKKFADWDNFLVLEEMEAEDWEFHEHFEESPKIKKFKTTVTFLYFLNTNKPKIKQNKKK